MKNVVGAEEILPLLHLWIYTALYSNPNSIAPNSTNDR